MALSLIQQEPLLKTRPDRPALLPIDPEFQAEWNLYKKSVASFWTLEELRMDDELKDWVKLDRDTQEFIETIFGFFSGADGIVNMNLAENFSRQINVPEIRCFYGFQTTIENIHNEVYSEFINTLIVDPARKARLLDAIHSMPNISKMYDWAFRWIHATPEMELATNPRLSEMKDKTIAAELAQIWTFAKRLVAFACVEGIMFSGPFCAIFWLKEKGVLPMLTFSNELISRDEGMHTEFACGLYSRHIVNKPPAEDILKIIQEAVEFEKEFIGTCLGRLVGMNKDCMGQYIEFVADKLLNMLGYQKHWNTPLPPAVKFMEKISFNGIANFFERQVGEYAKAGFEEGNTTKDLISDDF